MVDNVQSDSPDKAKGGNTALLITSWLWVGIPLAWGVLETLQKSLDLFR